MGMMPSVALRTPVALFGKDSARMFDWVCDVHMPCDSDVGAELLGLRKRADIMRMRMAEMGRTENWIDILDRCFWIDVAQRYAIFRGYDAAFEGKRGILRGISDDGGVGKERPGRIDSFKGTAANLEKALGDTLATTPILNPIVIGKTK